MARRASSSTLLRPMRSSPPSSGSRPSTSARPRLSRPCRTLRRRTLSRGDPGSGPQCSPITDWGVHDDRASGHHPGAWRVTRDTEKEPRVVGGLPWLRGRSIPRSPAASSRRSWSRQMTMKSLRSPAPWRGRSQTAVGPRHRHVAHEPVMEHALAAAEQALDLAFDAIWLLQPTSPLLEPQDVRRAREILESGQCDSVLSGVSGPLVLVVGDRGGRDHRRRLRPALDRAGRTCRPHTPRRRSLCHSSLSVGQVTSARRKPRGARPDAGLALPRDRRPG